MIILPLQAPPMPLATAMSLSYIEYTSGPRVVFLFRERRSYGRETISQPAPGMKSLRGIAKLSPGVKAPQQWPHHIKPFALEQECQPGTRGFVWSSAVHHDWATFRDLPDAEVEFAGRDVDRARNPQTLLLIGKLGTQIYNH